MTVSSSFAQGPSAALRSKSRLATPSSGLSTSIPVQAVAKGIDSTRPRIESGWGYITTFLLRDLDSLPEREAILRAAAAEAAPLAAKYRNWGEVHRLRAAHWLVNLPLLGRRFVLETFPVGGSRETAMKSGHGFVSGPHEVSFGSMARHVSDMADPDANWFTLFGGQDGWLGSAAFADQVPLWRERRSIRVPLRPETVAAEFQAVTVLRP